MIDSRPALCKRRERGPLDEDLYFRRSGTLEKRRILPDCRDACDFARNSNDVEPGTGEPEAVKKLNRDLTWLITVLNLQPKTRAERAFHLGGAGRSCARLTPGTIDFQFFHSFPFSGWPKNTNAGCAAFQAFQARM